MSKYPTDTTNRLMAEILEINRTAAKGDISYEEARSLSIRLTEIERQLKAELRLMGVDPDLPENVTSLFPRAINSADNWQLDFCLTEPYYLGGCL